MDPVISRPALLSKPMFNTNSSALQMKSKAPTTTTVFVGNISDKAPDYVIRQMLSKCGTVISWKRLTGVNNKPQAFGFCEYESPESTLRCIRVLNNWKVADKSLLVKVDEKTRTFLDQYLEEKKATNTQSGQSEESNGSNHVNGDLEVTNEDEIVRQELHAVMEEFAKEMTISEANKEATKEQKASRRDRLEGPKHLTIEDMGLDNVQKDLITKEIEVFRKLHQDDDFDRELRDRDSRMRYQLQQARSQKRMEEPFTSLGRHTFRSDSSKRHRSRSPSRAHSKSQNNRGQKSSSRVKVHPSESSETEDSNSEKLRMEKKILQKESAYNIRLQNWMKREQDMSHQYQKEMQKLSEKKRDSGLEAQRLFAFFQRYDDTRDDSKYYKGSNLTRRLRDRAAEEAADEQDRLKELDEIEEYRRILMAEENPDMEAILVEAEQKMTRHLQRKLNVLDLEELPVISNEPADDDRHSSHSESSSSPASKHPSTSPHRNVEPVDQNASSFHMKVSQQKQPNDTSQTAIISRPEATSNKCEVPPPLNTVKEESDMSGERQSFLALLEAARKGDANAKTQAVKAIIQRIPTEKEALFDAPINWEYIDSSFVNERIRPWVDKKINAYVGEDVPSLSEFICEQILLRKSPRNILQDVSMVLDDEAEVFVVKMWRLLIYVVQAKEAGIDS